MDFAKREQKTLRTWKREKTFHASVIRRRGKPRFVFYEGPPTANGRPGLHHVLVRSIKDAFLRYKTMRGFLVERRAGWDTHGLPVELEVEKQFGLKSKADIERYGVVRFNAKAKRSVWAYKDEWERLTDRIGFWIDQKNPYVTYENRYIESVWAILKHAWKTNLLQEDFKVVPFCTRCGTPLSSHEVAQGYQPITENSVYVKLRLKAGQKIGNFTTNNRTYILTWTTTPWTLPGNVALAVGKDIDYFRVRHGGNVYFFARAVAEKLFPGGYDILETTKGSGLVGLEYEPLFDIPETQNEKSHRVHAADFVNTEEGTGIVHTAVMYGEDDYRLGSKVGLSKVHTVGESGRFLSFVPDGLAGRYVKDSETEKTILAALAKRNLLFAEKAYTHDYPFCWRCGTPLLYYAKQAWFIQMSQLRDKLISENEKINWVPEHLREGRFGEWLREVKDWAISRERYWGTPLPIWRCENNPRHIDVVASHRELRQKAPLKNTYIALRHGYGTHNEAGTIAGYPEPRGREARLTPGGRRQITEAAKRLRKAHIDRIFSSDLRRTKETAEIVAKTINVSVQLDQRLREYNVGVFNGKRVSEHRAFLGSELAQWTKRAKGGETWGDVRKRMVDFIRDCERHFENKTILVVSHGDPLFVLKGALLGLSDEEYFTTKLSYFDLGKFETLQSSLAALNRNGAMDLHRPWIDSIELPCPRCSQKNADRTRTSAESPRKSAGSLREFARPVMRRVEEVLDVWFDSGAMPFASQRRQSQTKRGSTQKILYPADFICEAIDQTRGWFYTLLAVATIMGKERPYRNVICTGHVLDRHGKKMSKSKGNAVDPWEMVEKYGADAVRWYFYTTNQPWDPKRFDEKDIQQSANRFVGTLLNAAQFWKTYAPKQIRNFQKLSHLEKWILSRLHSTIARVANAMDVYDITAATRSLEAFLVDDVSNWYIRRSRERFQNPSSNDELMRASSFFAHILAMTARIAAPFAPFVAEEVFRVVAGGKSVHLEDFPKADSRYIKTGLEGSVRKEREVVAQALAIRKKLGIPVRQPLRSVRVPFELQSVYISGSRETTTAELNVKEIEFVAGGTEVTLDTEITPALRVEGMAREFIRAIQELRKTAGLTPKDRIVLRWHTSGIGHEALRPFEEDIRRVVRAKRLEAGPQRDRERLLADQKRDFAGATIWFGIRKME